MKGDPKKWVRFGPPECRTRVYTFAFLSDSTRDLIVGTRPDGFYRANAEIDSWQTIDVGCKFTLGIGPNQHGIAIDPQNSDVLFLGAEQHGILKSEDAGRTWGYANTGLLGKETHALNGVCFCFHPQNSRTILYGSDGGIYRSMDSGQTWAHLQQGLPALRRNSRADGAYWGTSVFRLGVHSSLSGRVYAGIYCAPPAESAGMYVSDDFGDSWHLCSTGLPEGKFGDLNDHRGVHDFAISHSNPNVMFAGLRTGLFRSQDRGVTWHPGGPFQMPVTAVCFHPCHDDTIFVALGDGSVCVSTDLGNTWKDISQGLPVNIRAERVVFQFANYDGTTEERTEYRWKSHIWKLGINPEMPHDLYAATPFGLFRRAIG